LGVAAGLAVKTKVLSQTHEFSAAQADNAEANESSESAEAADFSENDVLDRCVRSGVIFFGSCAPTALPHSGENLMTSLQALGIGIGTSVAIGAVLQAAISRPLRAFIGTMCAEPESVGFWLRFTVVMLILSPLFVTVAFGLPAPDMLRGIAAGELVQRAVSSSLIGAFLAMIGIGLWISSLTRRIPLPPQRSVNPNEFWGDRSKS
jgi:hypothetical protein